MFKLLIADDESLERQAIKFIVNNNCTEITMIEEASNGREAIEKATAFKPHIIMLDIKMPGIDGIEAAGRIKKLYPEIKIIFLTAFDYFEYAREAIKIGVENFIIKPAEDEQIIEAIKSITDELSKKNEQVTSDDKLAIISSFLESEVVYSLSIGEANEGQIKDLFEIMNIHSIKGCTAVIKFEGEGLQLEMIMKLYSDKIRAYMDQKDIYCFIKSVKVCLHIVVFPKVDMELEKINAEMRKIYNNLHNELKFHVKNRVAIGIGKSFSDIKGIYKSFSSARIACAACEGDIFVKNYEDIKKSPDKLYPIEKEKILFEKIILGDESSSLLIFDEIMEWIDNSYDNIEDKVLKAYELVIVINRNMVIEVKDKALGVSLKDMKHIDSIAELRFLIKEAIVRLIEELTYSKNEGSAAVIEKVCEYINNSTFAGQKD